MGLLSTPVFCRSNADCYFGVILHTKTYWSVREEACFSGKDKGQVQGIGLAWINGRSYGCFNAN